MFGKLKECLKSVSTEDLKHELRCRKSFDRCTLTVRNHSGDRFEVEIDSIREDEREIFRRMFDGKTLWADFTFHVDPVSRGE